jgi:hypothetical protein
MSKLIDLRQDSASDDEDNGELPNTASAPSLLLSKKRPRDKEESPSNDTHPRNENGPGNNKTATSSAEFVVDRELAGDVEVEVEVSPRRNKRRGVVNSEPSATKDAAGKCAQILKGVHATE